MSKYDSRIKKLDSKAYKLFSKIHVFISKKDISLINNYYESLITDSGYSPEKAQNIFAEVDKLEKEFLEDPRNDNDEKKCSDNLQRLHEITNDNYSIAKALLFRPLVRRYSNYPNGVWLLKTRVKSTLACSQEAKEYFENRETSLKILAELDREYLEHDLEDPSELEDPIE